MSRAEQWLVALLLAPSPVVAQAPETLTDLLAVEVSAASRFEQTTRRAPASVTVITAEEIEHFGYRTLGEALASVPGLYLTYDRNYSYLGVRGFSRQTDYNNRILVMVDGYRLNEDVYGYAPIGTDLALDLQAVERIEVVRGPGSAAFGTAAMLAVINVVLQQPETVADIEASVETGSHGHVAGSARGGGEAALGIGAAWSLSGFDTDGQDLYFPELDTPATGGGRVSESDFESGRSGTAVLAMGGFRLDALSMEREKGIPTAPWDGDFGVPGTRTTDRWNLMGLRYERALGRGVSIAARGQVGHYSYDGVYPTDGELWMDSTDNGWWGGDLQMTWEQSARHRLTAGFELRDNTRADYRTFEEDGTELTYQDRPFRVRSAFLEDELQIGENLILDFGVRHDDYPDAGSSTNPRLAVVYFPDRRTSVKLLYGRAFRAPNVYETRFGTDDDATKGNPGLQPERVATTELVVERTFRDTVSLGASLFRSRFDDLVEQRLDPADGLYQYQNAAGATSTGAEIDFRIRCCRGTMAYGSASYQRTVDHQTDERLTNSPLLLTKLGVTGHVAEHFRWALETRHESGRRTVQGGSTDSFLLINGNLGWDRGRWRADLLVRNLFDEDYAYPGGPEHRQVEIPQDGRTFTLRVGVRF